MGLFPLYFGATDWLLNADHNKAYFDGMPIYKGRVWTWLSQFSILNCYMNSAQFKILTIKTMWLLSFDYLPKLRDKFFNVRN